jgi:hypothetical protein
MVAIGIELRTGLKKLPYHHAIWNIIMYLRVYLYIYTKMVKTMYIHIPVKIKILGRVAALPGPYPAPPLGTN